MAGTRRTEASQPQGKVGAGACVHALLTELAIGSLHLILGGAALEAEHSERVGARHARTVAAALCEAAACEEALCDGAYASGPGWNSVESPGHRPTDDFAQAGKLDGAAVLKAKSKVCGHGQKSTPENVHDTPETTLRF